MPSRMRRPHKRCADARTRKKLNREHAAREVAEAHEARARFVAEASRILLSSLDHDTTLARFARLAVPMLGDLCIIDLLDGDKARRVATAHVDSEKELLMGELTRFPPHLSPPGNPIRRVLAAGRTIVAGPEDLVAADIAVDPEHQRLLEILAPRAGIFVPMLGPDGPLGVVSFVSTSSRVYRADEVALAEDLAYRAALAITNAQLFHQAQQATRARDEILSVVAHDLRNPLGVIRGATQMITEIGSEERINPFLAMIRRSTDTMNRLIGDLLEVGRLESRDLKLDLGNRSAVTLARDAAEMLQPLAEGAGIELRLDLDGNEMVVADDMRVLQVFSNLVGNAIKFTPRGGIVTLATIDLGSEVRFAIIDTGPGIPPDQLPHVFGRFWQADTADRRGLGLGLAIAKSLIEGHRGRIWLESMPGRGTAVFFTLPKPEAKVEGSTRKSRARKRVAG